jgi:1,6-anhydro-N-acetylmuramate kinase
MTPRYVIGCMTGTSLDGIDAALVAIEGVGLGMRAKPVACASLPLGDLAPRLRALAEQRPATAAEVAGIMRDFALLHGAACREVLGRSWLNRPDLICVHGQTVYHKPPLSWQLMQPAPLAAEYRCPVVFDLRAIDLACGGQGAPLTPIADRVLFGECTRQTAVVNLGGFVNATMLTRKGSGIVNVAAADLAPCNNLLDAIARTMLRTPFDKDGAAATAGKVNEEALEDLEGIFVSLRAPRRSLGTGDETGEWISRFRAHLPAGDVAATACEAIAATIEEFARGAEAVLLAGGGVHNLALRSAIERRCSGLVRATDVFGVPASHREAIGWAVLGALCQDRVPIGLPQVTGCREPALIGGSWVLP